MRSGVSVRVDAPRTSAGHPLFAERFQVHVVAFDHGATTENHPDGSPYWGGTSTYPPSPVVPGHNEFRWAAVTPPRTSYEFDRSKIIAIQFHVSAVTVGTTRGAYSFCISNLTFLTQ